MKLCLDILPGRYAVSRLSGFPELPPLPNGESGKTTKVSVPVLFSLTVTDGETSLVAPEVFSMPGTETREDGFKALRVAGTLDFGQTGILSKLTGILAAEDIPVFVVSTYNTDYLLIRERFLDRAIRALSGSGAEAVADGTADDWIDGANVAADKTYADGSEPRSVGAKKRKKR